MTSEIILQLINSGPASRDCTDSLEGGQRSIAAIMPISLNEDMLGYDPAEIIIPNIIVCGAVLIRLNVGGFVGMHFTPNTSTQEITLAATYARDHLIPATGIRDLVFFVDKKGWGDAKVQAESLVLQTAFGMAPTIKPKPENPDGRATLDLRIRTPPPHSSSWIGVRPHRNGPSTRVSPNNPNVFKIARRTGQPPSIVVDPIQTLPDDLSGFQDI